MEAEEVEVVEVVAIAETVAVATVEVMAVTVEATEATEIAVEMAETETVEETMVTTEETAEEITETETETVVETMETETATVAAITTVEIAEMVTGMVTETETVAHEALKAKEEDEDVRVQEGHQSGGDSATLLALVPATVQEDLRAGLDQAGLQVMVLEAHLAGMSHTTPQATALTMVQVGAQAGCQFLCRWASFQFQSR